MQEVIFLQIIDETGLVNWPRLKTQTVTDGGNVIGELEMIAIEFSSKVSIND